MPNNPEGVGAGQGASLQDRVAELRDIVSGLREGADQLQSNENAGIVWHMREAAKVIETLPVPTVSTPAGDGGEAPAKQAFERHPKLAAWIEKLAVRKIDCFSLASWCAFLGELNAALDREAAPSSPSPAPSREAELVEALRELHDAARAVGQHLVYNAPTKDISAALDRAAQALGKGV